MTTSQEPDRVIAFVTEIVNRFLSQHGFAPANVAARNDPPPPPETTNHQAAPAPLFSGLKDFARPKRRRTGLAADRADGGENVGGRGLVPSSSAEAASAAVAPTTRARSKRRAIATRDQDEEEAATQRDRDSRTVIAPPVTIAGPAPATTTTEEAEGDAPDALLWTDSTTGLVWEIDPRTGNSRRADVARPRLGCDGTDTHHDRPLKSGAMLVDRSALRSRSEDANGEGAGAVAVSPAVDETPPAWLEEKLAVRSTRVLIPVCRNASRQADLHVTPCLYRGSP